MVPAGHAWLAGQKQSPLMQRALVRRGLELVVLVDPSGGYLLPESDDHSFRRVSAQLRKRISLLRVVMAMLCLTQLFTSHG
jgi:hypothetical protein